MCALCTYSSAQPAIKGLRAREKQLLTADTLRADLATRQRSIRVGVLHGCDAHAALSLCFAKVCQAYLTPVAPGVERPLLTRLCSLRIWKQLQQASWVGTPPKPRR